MGAHASFEPSRLPGTQPLSDQHDLRAGRLPWPSLPRLGFAEVQRDFRCEVLVVGAGITGAMAAQHLAARGHQVCLIDRERPGWGSTAASTALLLWELDTELGRLAAYYGFEKAARIYRLSHRAVAGLRDLMANLGRADLVRPRHSLYIASDTTPGGALLAEQELRARAGLPSVFLDYATLRRRYGVDREAAILSDDAADADPVHLARVLTEAAVAQGAALLDAEAVSYEPFKAGVGVTLAGGHTVEAEHVVLATGYVMPPIVSFAQHSISSTFAIATPPQPERCWTDGVLIWEACENYLYARTTTDGRMMIGGEDEELDTPEARDALLPAKRQILLRRLSGLCPAALAEAEFSWAGTFGHTSDGMPLIGRVPGQARLIAAYGYGGNGITFSFLASRMVAALVEGREEEWFGDFAPDRDPPRS